MVTKAAGIVFVNGALDGIRFHQTYGAEWKPDAMFEHAALKEIQFEAASTEVKNQSRLETVVQGPFHGGANQASLFFAADYFQFNSRFSLDAVHQFAMVAGFASGGGSHSSISADLMGAHAVAELAEDSSRARDSVVIEQTASERIVAQPHRGALIVQDLNVMGRSGACNNEPNGVGAGIDRG
jgi:hypothetical protein